jgi:hypothetical protein
MTASGQGGQPLKLKKLARVSVVAVAVAGPPAAAESFCSDLTISNVQGDSHVPGGITGTATNTSDHAMRSATVFFNLYDSGGAVIGNAADNQFNLAAGQRWNFRAATAQPFSRFQLSSSSCVAAQ